MDAERDVLSIRVLKPKFLSYIEDDCEWLSDHDVPHVETEPGGGHHPELRLCPAQAPGAQPGGAQHGARQH